MEQLVNIKIKGTEEGQQVPASQVPEYIGRMRQTYKPIIDKAARVSAHFAARKDGDKYKIGGGIELKDVLNEAKRFFADNAPSEDALVEFGQDITPIWGDLRALSRAYDMMTTPIDPTQFIHDGQFDAKGYNKAHMDKGAEMGLELASGVPLLGLGSLAFAKAVKFAPQGMENLMKRPGRPGFGQDGAVGLPMDEASRMDRRLIPIPAGLLGLGSIDEDNKE